MEIRLLITGQPGFRRQESYTGFYMEREKLSLRCANEPLVDTGFKVFQKEAEA